TCSIERTLERHTRWAKLRRAQHPAGFVFEPLLTPAVVATLAFAAMPTRLCALLLLASMALQVLGSMATLRALRGRMPPWYFVPLELVRSYVVFYCWLRALASRRVSWRGHDFILEAGSVIRPAPPSRWARLRAAVAGT